MKIVNDSIVAESKEVLPQIIQRIFSVCKVDPNFPMKTKIQSVDGKVSALKEKVNKQMAVARRAKKTRDDLIERINDLEERNEDEKHRLLDLLGRD